MSCMWDPFWYNGQHIKVIWSSMREHLSSEICEQQRRRPACASALSDQPLCCSLFVSIIAKLAKGEISNFYAVSLTVTSTGLVERVVVLFLGLP